MLAGIVEEPSGILVVIPERPPPGELRQIQLSSEIGGGIDQWARYPGWLPE